MSRAWAGTLRPRRSPCTRSVHTQRSSLHSCVPRYVHQGMLVHQGAVNLGKAESNTATRVVVKFPGGVEAWRRTTRRLARRPPGHETKPVPSTRPRAARVKHVKALHTCVLGTRQRRDHQWTKLAAEHKRVTVRTMIALRQTINRPAFVRAVPRAAARRFSVKMGANVRSTL